MAQGWIYPDICQYYHAMADYAVSEANLPHFLQVAAETMTQRAIHLAAHNLALYAQHQANAISWASRV
jgi:hypothetical protein